MELAVYAHPWDLRALAAHGGLARLRDLGFRELALAVSYHAGRWLTPWHPDGLVRFLEDGTVHFVPRGDYGPLQPARSAEVRDGEPSPLERLCSEAPGAGLRARAWAVLTHNSRLGALHPDCCVENALGDRYLHALCPAHPHVQRYVQSLVADLAAHAGLDAIELEAFGWMGWRHNSHHEKASFAPEPLTEWLLSLCWCRHCTAGLDDAAHVRQQVASLLRARFADADAMADGARSGAAATRLQQLSPRPGEPLAGRLGDEDLRRLGQAFDRRPWIERQLRALRARADARVRLALQVDPREYGHGSAAPGSSRYALELGARAEFVLTCYGDGPDGIARALAAAPRPAGGRGSLRLSFHPRAPQFRGDDDLWRLRDLCAEHAVASLALYHLGLLPWRTIERAARILTA